jgi:hypothetical protein
MSTCGDRILGAAHSMDVLVTDGELLRVYGWIQLECLAATYEQFAHVCPSFALRHHHNEGIGNCHAFSWTKPHGG